MVVSRYKLPNPPIGPYNIRMIPPLSLAANLPSPPPPIDNVWYLRTLSNNYVKGPLRWEKIPSASEKNCQSRAWFTVKKNSIHIKTKKFSIWSVFACGGTKRKRATVYFSRHNPRSDHIYLRFYIYSDNEDSKKVSRKTSSQLKWSSIA